MRFERWTHSCPVLCFPVSPLLTGLQGYKELINRAGNPSQGPEGLSPWGSGGGRIVDSTSVMGLAVMSS